MRAARNFATSSKKSLCAFQKNEMRGATVSMPSPALCAARRYAFASASVNAISCSAVEPASRMW